MPSKQKKLLNSSPVSPSKAKNTTGCWAVVTVLVLVISLMLGYKYKDVLKPNVAVVVALDDSCDLRAGVCVSDLPSGGKVSFSISPTDIPLLRPLVLQVKTEGVEALSVEVDFIGIGMEMGYNRSRLKSDQESNKNQFTGKGTLPVCVRSKMDWEARVLLKTNEGLVMVPFQFFTNK